MKARIKAANVHRFVHGGGRNSQQAVGCISHQSLLKCTLELRLLLDLISNNEARLTSRSLLKVLTLLHKEISPFQVSKKHKYNTLKKPGFLLQGRRILSIVVRCL